MSLFITLEGPEGGGKSLQARLLAEWLRGQGYPVLATREPGGTPIGDQIRQVITDLKNTAMHERTEILLFQASRAQHVEEAIKPHLARGGVVVCDRFGDSTLAYQGFGYGYELKELRRLVSFATGGITPDVTFLLDIDPAAGLKRKQISGEWNRLDALQLAFHHRVRAGFLQLAADEPERWVCLDAALPPETIQEMLREETTRRLNQKAAEKYAPPTA